MNILVDESVGQQIVARLRDDGHDVLYIAEMAPGVDDEEVLGAANEHDALLLTADKDFGELVFRWVASPARAPVIPGQKSQRDGIATTTRGPRVHATEMLPDTMPRSRPPLRKPVLQADLLLIDRPTRAKEAMTISSSSTRSRIPKRCTGFCWEPSCRFSSSQGSSELLRSTETRVRREATFAGVRRSP